MKCILPDKDTTPCCHPHTHTDFFFNSCAIILYWLVTWLLSLVKLNLVSSDINLVHSFWVLYDVPGMIIPHFIFVSLLLDIICMIMNLLYIFSLAHICIFPRGKSQKVDRWTIYIRAYTVLSWFDSFVSGKDSFLAL